MSVGQRIVTTELIVDYPRAGGPVRALALDGLVIDGGGTVAIMGPSGCGKSTLLGLLAGLAVPSTGTVTIGDTIISGLPEADRVR